METSIRQGEASRFRASPQNCKTTLIATKITTTTACARNIATTC